MMRSSVVYRNGRRLLLNPYRLGYVQALTEARAELLQVNAELQAELAEVQQELNELKAMVRRRNQADAELASLYRERTIERAQAVEREQNEWLH